MLIIKYKSMLDCFIDKEIECVFFFAVPTRPAFQLLMSRVTPRPFPTCRSLSLLCLPSLACLWPTDLHRPQLVSGLLHTILTCAPGPDLPQPAFFPDLASPQSLRRLLCTSACAASLVRLLHKLRSSCLSLLRHLLPQQQQQRQTTINNTWRQRQQQQQ